MTAAAPTCGQTGTSVLVLGIGNLLWADEGFGVRCVERLHRLHVMAPGVTVIDGGTQGLYLVPYVRQAHRLIVFDAIDYGLPPGTLKQVRDDAVPCFTGARKMSLHQTGFQDVLSAASLLGGTPDEMLLIGVQAGALEDWGGSLTGPVRARLDEAVSIALDQLAAWGYPASARCAPAGASAVPEPNLLGPGLDIAAYERARPAA